MAKKQKQNKHAFTAEIKQLLNIMINSLYSNKEIFLRELISNASDACEKLRFESLSNEELAPFAKDFKIHISIDQESKLIEIEDNGIGMNEEDVINNLGTIARSGTSEFLKSVKDKDSSEPHSMIGQFGVGFYSSFIVAKEVEVFTRKAGSDISEGVHWRSEGDGEFEISSSELQDHGTKIRLHLKDESMEFLNSYLVKQVVQNYSSYVNTPIFFKKDAEELKSAREKDADAQEFDLITGSVALWQKKPKIEVSDEEYKEFYRTITHDYNDPITWTHNKVEGKLEYTSLLYIPSKAPGDMWQRGGDMGTRGLKLFVQRVFIMDKVQAFLPNYLRFVRGVLDSNDLDLNISREILQQSAVVNSIRHALTRRVLEMFLKLSEENHEEYMRFYEQFAMALKEGIFEERDERNKEILRKLYRFYSTHSESSGEQIHSLADYTSRMPETQKNIYYLQAETYEKAINNPIIEGFIENNCEVLLLTDPIDDWFTSSINEYEEKPFKNIMEADSFEFGDRTKEPSESEKETIEKIKEALKDDVEDVKVSTRLKSAASCLVHGPGYLSASIRKMMEMAGQKVSVNKPTIEINPEHFLVKLLDNTSAEESKEISQVIYDHALIASGEPLGNPAQYVERINKLLEKNINK